jgi:WD40 repeat protein
MPEFAHEKEIKSALFSPDGGRVVTASIDNTARIWNANSGVPLGDAMQHRGAVYFAVFSPDGQRIATASGDSTARVWDAQTGRAMTAPLKHGANVMGAAFSADNTRLVTASIDRTARIWDVSYHFDKAEDVIKLLEVISGYSAADQSVPALQDPQRRRLLADVQSESNQSGSTAAFLKWFLAHRQ